MQVASSFILELSRMVDRLISCRIYIYASSSVDKNLSESGFDKNFCYNYTIINTKGIQSLKHKNANIFYGFDLVFTIFGPLYVLPPIKNHIIGFAQSWIIYPNNETNLKISLGLKIKLRIKFLIQWWFFKHADRLIVELQHVKNGLIASKKFPANRIDIAHNCVSAIFFDSKLWSPLPIEIIPQKNVVTIGLISRDYPHKNLDFFIPVAKYLKKISTINYRFYVTLTLEEWASRSKEFKENVTNIGPLTISQCPTFYRSMDAVLFPSLLESFSASPLESMVMKRPLFASDRGFVRDCCGENALYFDPLNSQQAALKVDEWFSKTDENIRSIHIEKAYRHVMSLPKSTDRSMTYITIINNQLTV